MSAAREPWVVDVRVTPAAHLGPFVETHLWGRVTGDDGRVFCPVRSVAHATGTRGRRLTLCESTREGLRPLPVAATTARGGDPSVELDGGVERLVAAAGADGGPWSIRLGPDGAAWTESGVLELTGSATGPAATWSLRPTDGPDVDYRVRCCRSRVRWVSTQ